MKIKIYKICLEDTHTLYMNDKNRNYIIADRKETSYSEDRFKFKVLDMVSDWKKEMTNPNVVDGVEYKIVINDEDKEVTYAFKNEFPKDIFRLESLIDEVLEELTYEK